MLSLHSLRFISAFVYVCVGHSLCSLYSVCRKVEWLGFSRHSQYVLNMDQFSSVRHFFFLTWLVSICHFSCVKFIVTFTVTIVYISIVDLLLDMLQQAIRGTKLSIVDLPHAVSLNFFPFLCTVANLHSESALWQPHGVHMLVLFLSLCRGSSKATEGWVMKFVGHDICSKFNPYQLQVAVSTLKGVVDILVFLKFA